MGEISPKKRMQVLTGYFQGLSYDSIVKATGVSKGSVVTIIRELKEGVYPEFHDVLDQVEDLRDLLSTLKKTGLTSEQARLGLVFFDQLVKLGVEPQDVKHWVKLCRGITSQEYPTEKLVEAAVRLVRYEEKTGKTYAQILAELEAIGAEKEKLEREAKDLVEEKKRVEGEVTGKRKELEGTSKELNLAMMAEEGLKKIGVGKVANLAKFVEDYERLGFNVEGVKALAELKREIMDLGMKPGELKESIKEKGSLEKKILEAKMEAEYWLSLKSSLLKEAPHLTIIEQILRTRAISLPCYNCRNLVPVRVEGKAAYSDFLAKGFVAYKRCPSCGYQNQFHPNDVILSIGWQLLPP